MSLLLGGLAIGSKLLGANSKRKQSKKEKAAAGDRLAISNKNIETKRMENAETERRAQRSIRAAEGEAALRSGAGGIKTGSTNTQNVLNSMIGENKKQMDWLKLANQSTLDTMRQEADFDYASGLAQSKATRWSAVADVGSAAGLTDELFPTLFSPATKAVNPLGSSTPTRRPSPRPATTSALRRPAPRQAGVRI